MESLILQGLTIDELLNAVREIVKQELGNTQATETQDDTLIDVKEVAALCGGVSTITVHNWSKPGGPLTKYKMGGRVFWKKGEVIASKNHRK